MNLNFLKDKSIILLSLSVVLGIGLLQGVVYSESLVPDWIKNTAKWFGDGLISDQEYLDSIKYLIENNIIVLEEKPEPVVTPGVPIDVEVSVTKPRVNQCSVLYHSYKNIGEQNFKQKYKHINYLNICIKPYKDSVWKYTGEDRVDKLYERFIEIRDENKPAEKPPTSPTVSILSKTKIGTEKFLVKFNICAGDATLDKAKVLIKSEIEALQYGSNKDITADTCRNYETQINAKHSDNIKISIIEQVLES